MHWLNFTLSDLAVRLETYLRSGQTSANSVLVLIQNSTVQIIGSEPKLSHWNRVLESIGQQGARAIVITKPLARWSDEDVPNLAPFIDFDFQSLKEFNRLLRKYPIFQQTDRLFLSGNKSREHLASPFDQVPILSAPKTSDTALFAEDGVTRRLLLRYQEQELGHYELAKKINPNIPKVEDIPGKFALYDSDQVWMSFRRSGYFPVVAFQNLLTNEGLDQNIFRDKVVFIGEDLGKSLKDYIKTPFSKDPSSMTVTEYHANALETIVENRAIRYVSQTVAGIISFILVIAVLYGSFHSQPFIGFISLFGTLVTVFIINFIAYFYWNWQVPLAHIIISVTLSYYILLPYRLLIEQRKTWEVQQKNALLSQVEELKTNFISMMSHDLKTPIARIQGMTDIILKDSVILSTKQREAIDYIRSSSEDLLRVLNAILSYAKIESDGVVLNKTSRDINKLVEEVIQRYQFLAKVKNIQVIFEPEPLFPIQVDGEIMKQVISNLIENAIKYSPENTKVLIVTEEVEGVIRLQISDQGIGIQKEDLPFLFSKFFRGAQAKASPVKGSGLGLYLTKYFIELHGGRISVESEVSLGTTFTVDLPIA